MPLQPLRRFFRLRLFVSVLALVVAGWPSDRRVAAQAPAPSLQLLLKVNQPFLGTGATLRVDIGAVNTGGAVAADFLWGLILPGGSHVFQMTGGGLAPGTLANLASLRPFLGGVTVPGNFAHTVPDFFAYTFQGIEPLGRYTVYFAATRPGSLRDGRIDGGDLLALETRTFDVAPPVSTVPDTTGAVTATITPDLGGTLQATATTGVRYTLDVPAGVLRAPTAITLTPASAGSPPATGNVVAALRAGPAGLHFDGPVSLTIEVPGGVPDGALIVLVAPEHGGGAEVLFGQRVGPTTLEVRGITHFSQFVVTSGLAGGLPSLSSPTGLQFQLQAQVLKDAIGVGLLTEAEFFVAFRDNLLAWEAFVNALLADGEQATTPAGREGALADAMVSFDQWDITRLLMLAFTAAPEGDPTRPQWVAFNAAAKALGIATRARLGRLARAHMLAFDDQCRATRSLAAAEDELRTVIRNEAYMLSLEEGPSPDRDTLPPMPLDDYRALGRTFPNRAEFCVRTDILDLTSTAVQVANPVTISGRAGVFFDQDTSPTFRPDVEVTVDGAPPTAQVSFTALDGSFSATLTPNRPDPVFFIDAALIPSGSAISAAWRLLGDSRQLPESVLAIAPAQVTLQPGATQAFTATVDGQPVPATTVIWSATGGTITPQGLFTAGNVAGTFFVTATDSLNSNVVATAQVTIGTPPPVLPASVTLLLQATRSNTSATCTPPAGFGGQVSIAGPLPLSGAVSCTDGTAGSASIAANGATVAWSGSMQGVVNPVTQATAIVNVVSSFELTPVAGTVTLTVNPDWSSVHFNARISAEYGPTTVTAWTGRDAAGILDASLPLTASLPVTPVPGQVLIIRVLQACLGECVGSGTFATVTLPQ